MYGLNSHVASGYHNGQHRYKTFSQLQKVLWDSTAEDYRSIKYEGDCIVQPLHCTDDIFIVTQLVSW